MKTYTHKNVYKTEKIGIKLTLVTFVGIEESEPVEIKHIFKISYSNSTKSSCSSFHTKKQRDSTI